MTLKRHLKRGAIVLLVVLVSGLLWKGIGRLRQVQATAALPTTGVRNGDFFVIVRCRGELKARRSIQINAPVNVPELRIVWLAPPGSLVKAGDVILRFDPSSARQQLQEKEAELKQAQASLDQAVAQARIAAEQDKIDLAGAEYQVERAKLEASKAEIVSAMKGEESRIDLGMAEARRGAQQAGVSLNQVSSEARTASLTRARDKARDEVELTRYRLQQMERTAPLTGLVNYLPNYSQGWMNAKPFKVGDQVWPSASIAEIPDLDSLEMEGKVEEIDRGRIALGQEVRIRIDSLPEINFPGRLASVSPMTVTGWEWPPMRTFRGFAKLERSDARLRPGMNGAIDIVVDRIPRAISIPTKALFTHQGKPIVYLASRGQYRAVEVEVLARNPDDIAIRGIPETSQVALAEPQTKGPKP